MLEGERLRIAGTAGHARNHFKGFLDTESAFSGEAIRTKATKRTSDLRSDPRWKALEQALGDATA